ncbi:MAG: NUDIX domain-containing protein [Oscillospiraceae bacterium]|nr:NUDIX domain-containing protein [Oscillospiraceae bacterium]
MELWDIYDKDRTLTGRTMKRGEPIADGDYHLVVHVCVFNTNGQMLIQQRQPFKEGWSNLWDITVGGSAVAGDTSRSAAVREVMEEIGLVLSEDELRPVMTVNFNGGFDDMYVVTRDVDLSSLKLQYEEVQAVKWADMDEILSMIEDKRFLPYNKSVIGLLFHFKDHMGTHTE